MRRVEAGARHAKKSHGLLRETTEVKYRFIAAHPEHPGTRRAEILHVSHSAYYAWEKSRGERDLAARTYVETIRDIFEASGGCYGVGRVCAELRKKGLRVSFYPVRDRMAKLGLKSVCRRRSLTDSHKARQGAYPNLVRKLEISEPFQVLSSDITYIRTKEGV